MNAAPSHVPENLVIDFNIYNDQRLAGDLHLALKQMHADLPDIFWTPQNGGHWVVTRYSLIEEICTDHDHFSARGNHVPFDPDGMVMIPLNLDPPEHTVYRNILLKYFGPAAIRKLEPRVQSWAGRLIDNVVDKGECDFMAEVGSLFPVSIFMEMMGLPLDRLHEYRDVVVEYFGEVTPERWVELQQQISQFIKEVLDERKVEPKDDMCSLLQQDELNGRKLTYEELDALTNLLFQAGMDTVANFAGFFFRFLGERPDLQKLLRENPDRVTDFVEEGFRMFGVVNNGRMLTEDREVGGLGLKAGEILITMLPLAGLDDRENPDPLHFDIDRKQRKHLLFSKGAHICIGNTLARLEVKHLLLEWFARIPEFRLKEGYEPKFRAGQVMGIDKLPLEYHSTQ